MTWDWPGGRLLLTPGRVLQVTLAGIDTLWTDPVARDWNAGGDRLWFGPERDWFWATEDAADPGDLAGHLVPAEIDPGKWRTDRLQPRHARFAADPVLHHRRTGATTRLHVIRDVYLRYADSTRVVYEVHTTLQIAEAPPAQEVSAWSVLQVPTGGSLEIELTGPWAYRDYLEPVDQNRLRVTDTRAEVRLTGRTMGKIGVRPDVFGGRLRYTHDNFVIERHVDVQPQRRYCDHPLGADRAEQGDALQVFEDDGHYGGYVEIEHHSPAIGGKSPRTVVDVCRTVVSVRQDS